MTHAVSATVRALTTAQLDELECELRREQSRNTGSLREPVIAAALDRIANGTFGLCATCHEPISYDRLAVMPETERCVGCVPA